MSRRRAITQRPETHRASTVSTPLTLDLVLDMRRYAELHKMYTAEKVLNTLIKEMRDHRMSSILRRELSPEALGVVDHLQARHNE